MNSNIQNNGRVICCLVVRFMTYWCLGGRWGGGGVKYRRHQSTVQVVSANIGKLQDGFRQQVVMNNCLFSYLTWMAETIEKMIQETKRKKNKNGTDGFTCRGSNLEIGEQS